MAKKNMIILKVSIEIDPNWLGDRDSFIDNVDAKIRNYVEGSTITRGKVIGVREVTR